MLINQQTTPVTVQNPLPFFPNLTTTDLVDLMRVDKTLGNDRLANAIANAYVVVNGQICLVDLRYRFGTPERIPNIWLHLYKQAILHEATAQLCELHADFDTIGQGLVRGDVAKADSLRRLVQHFIADMNGSSRNRVRLL